MAGLVSISLQVGAPYEISITNLIRPMISPTMRPENAPYECLKSFIYNLGILQLNLVIIIQITTYNFKGFFQIYERKLINKTFSFTLGTKIPNKKVAQIGGAK